MLPSRHSHLFRVLVCLANSFEMWPFCPHCGTILDPPVTDKIKCKVCQFTCKFDEFHAPDVVTTSRPKPKPHWVTDDNENKKSEESEKVKHAVIAEPCPKCAHHEMYFYTMQLRSVDEGSTVFYECPKCSHKYSVNN